MRKFQALNGWAKQQVLIKKQQKQLQQRQSSIEGDKFEVQVIREVALSQEEKDLEYRNLMNRLNKEVNIKLDKISNEDLVKLVLPTKFFSNDKIFEIMADESRHEY